MTKCVPAGLIFEGSDGAFKHEPEEIPLPVAATAIALGRLDYCDEWIWQRQAATS